MAQDTPSRKLDQYIVRFPDGMRDRLKETAARNNRSLNAEIISRLEDSFVFDDFGSSTGLAADVQALTDRLEGLRKRREEMKTAMTTLEGQAIAMQVNLAALSSEVVSADLELRALKGSVQDSDRAKGKLPE